MTEYTQKMIKNIDTTTTVMSLYTNSSHVRLYNITYQSYFSPLEFHPADGATAAVISQLSTMSIFTIDTNILKLHSSRLFLVGVLRLIQ